MRRASRRRASSPRIAPLFLPVAAPAAAATMPEPTFCAIDFGTSNSAVAVADGATMRLIELEPGFRTMPTAVFYPGEGAAPAFGAPPPCEFGRAAIAAYVDGIDGRLMRSMKSILGSSLIEQTTDVGGGRGVKLHRRRRDLPAPPAPHGRGGGWRAGRARGARPAGLLRRRRPGARRPGAKRRCAAPPRAPAFARSSSSTSRSPPPSTTSKASTAKRRCWSPTSAAARRTSRSSGSAPSGWRGSIARATSSPTTASTSPAPTSIAGSSWRRSCRCSATARSAPRSTARRRARCRAASTSTSPPGT